MAQDPISASTALHLAFLTLAEASRPVHDLVLELAARDPERGDATDVLAPLSEVALYVEQRIAAGDDGRGLPQNVDVLARLWRCLDDPREQALVREQLARLRLAELRRALGGSPSPDALRADPARASLADAIAADLRFCLVHLPEHRWVREALTEVLRWQGNLPGLVLHLQEWARTQSAGPDRAAILLRLGQLHEQQRRDLPRAAEVYELAAAEDPDNPNCQRALGSVYERMRRWTQAAQCLRRQIDNGSDEQDKLTGLRRLAAMAEHELADNDLADRGAAGDHPTSRPASYWRCTSWRGPAAPRGVPRCWSPRSSSWPSASTTTSRAPACWSSSARCRSCTLSSAPPRGPATSARWR
ncbi:MAG: hypothetical protein U0168_13205 [Nannocystaceae bacterium]